MAQDNADHGGAGHLDDQVRGLLGEDLDRRLVASRPAGDRAGGVSYLEGHTVIAQLNRIFGYDGWGYSLDAHGIDEYTEGPEAGQYALFWAQVTLRVRGSLARTELGRCEVRNTVERKSGAVRNNVRNVDSRSTALAGAVTDALKRAARTYGQQFGNGLYDADGDVYRWMTARADEGLEEGLPPTEAQAPVPDGALPASPPQKAQTQPAAAKDTGFSQRAGAALRTAQSRTAPPVGVAPPAEPEPDAGLRAEVLRLLEDDGAALDLLGKKGTLPADMDAEQLAKTKDWLRKRASRTLPLQGAGVAGARA